MKLAYRDWPIDRKLASRERIRRWARRNPDKSLANRRRATKVRKARRATTAASRKMRSCQHCHNLFRPIVRSHQKYCTPGCRMAGGSLRYYYRRRRRSEACRQRARVYSRAWYRNHREQMLEKSNQWGKRNPERRRELSRAAASRMIAVISDSYVRGRLASGVRLSARDFPPEIVELKRKHLMALRLLGKNTPKKKDKTYDISANR